MLIVKPVTACANGANLDHQTLRAANKEHLI